jgi:predicted nucleic acid-binding Zn ribbon protein|tara:strand:- start:4181 stop:4378 length:198 start_codon:yes stop_codon:yes gene_type:complete
MNKIAELEMDMKSRVANIHTKIEKHESVCAERWLEILNRVKRIEHFIVATLITLVAGMAGIIFGA